MRLKPNFGRVLVCLAAALIGLASIHLWANATRARRAGLAPPVAQGGLPAINYIQCGRLRPPLCNALNAVGSRFEKPGKERLTISGTLTALSAAGTSVVLNVRLITEYPHKMRLEEHLPQTDPPSALVQSGTRVIAFDGQTAWSNTGALTPQDLTLIQSIVFDSADQFFIGQTNRLATRALGQGFRTDNGTTPNYNGPYYDIYQVFDQTTMAGQSSLRPKLYYLKSDTQRLERVRYVMLPLNLPVPNPTKVDVLTTTWMAVGDQYIPTTIERRENGSSIWTLTLSANGATLSPLANDGIFTRPF